MKTKIFLTAGLLLLGTFGMSGKDSVITESSDETIRVCATPDTRSLVESWTTDYSKKNPGVNFKIESINFSGFNNELANKNTLGFLIKRPDIAMGESFWQMVVGREVIVPVINNKNPFAETLVERGISAKEFADLLKTRQWRQRNEMDNTNQNPPVHFYVLNESDVQLSVSKLLDIDPVEIKLVETKSAQEFLHVMQSDVYAVGFCRLATITDTEKHGFVANIKLLPFDRNNNGKIDFSENIYNKLEDFERAVWIGKYPKAMIYNIYAVSSTFPENRDITGFLNWIVTSGQSEIEQCGYTDLIYSEKQSNLAKLNPTESFIETSSTKAGRTVTILLLSIAFVGLVWLVFFFVRRNQSRKLSFSNVGKERVFSEESLEMPGGLFFDKTHTWVFMEKDGNIKVGIDDFLQHVTGDLTGIIMKEPGEKLTKNDPAVTLVKDGKKLNIYSPVSGTIKENNEDLVDYPSLINNSPYAWGWIYTMVPSNWYREISFLKMADSYKEWIQKEFVRLKDFLTSASQSHMPAGKVVYQEGGELQDHPLQSMGPKAWEDFQIMFIDTSDIN